MRAMRSLAARFRRHRGVYLFVLPAVVLLGLFQYYPAASGLLHSFYRWNGADVSEYVGFGNYVDLLRSREFWGSFRLAFVLGAWNVFKMVPAILVAVCIHRCHSARLQFFYRCLFVVPMVIPGLVMVLIWRSFFFEATSGYLNRLLTGSGLYALLCRLDGLMGLGAFTADRLPVWLGDPNLLVISCVIWGFPWVGSLAILIHLAKLQGIHREIYEAAEMDGVNAWTKFTRIELPLMMGSIYILLVFVIIDTLRDAGTILALVGIEGGPGGRLTVPSLFMMRKAFLDQQMGYACAVGVVLTLVILGLQKLSGSLVHWSQWTPRQRLAFKVACLAGALLLLGLAAGPLWSGAALAALALGLWLRGRGASAAAPVAAAGGGGRREAARAAPRSPRAVAWLARAAKHGFIWAMLLTALFPAWLLMVVSLKTNEQFYEKPAVITQPAHWENWVVAWNTIAPSIHNTVFFSFCATFLGTLVSLAGAYFFARRRVPLSAFLWNAIIILMMMPTIANLVPMFRLIRDLGLLDTLTALILVGSSAGLVGSIFILRNFVADIPQDLFDAAEIDGAGDFRQMMMVVVPLSGPILANVGIMQLLMHWNDFVLPLVIMSDQARLPVTVQLLRMAGEYIKFWGPLMAGYALASIPVVLIFIVSMKLFVRGMTEGGSKG